MSHSPLSIETLNENGSSSKYSIYNKLKQLFRRKCYNRKTCYIFSCFCLSVIIVLFIYYAPLIFIHSYIPKLTLSTSGSFKILQVADIHFGNGETDKCVDINLTKYPYSCSSLNSTQFIKSIVDIENPDLIIYTGDNIDSKASNGIVALNSVFNLRNQGPWAAILGNHDQESSLSRYQVMNYISSMTNSLAYSGTLDGRANGFGNYVISLMHPNENTNLMNLYFLDSGDYNKKRTSDTRDLYDKIHISQIQWYDKISKKLNGGLVSLDTTRTPIPAIAFFHIPIPEYKTCKFSNMTGSRLEEPVPPDTNSGFFSKLVERGDVRMVNVGHDHLNDFCGRCDVTDRQIWLCYGGGVGYTTYGKVGHARRVRIINIEEFGKTIKTWKRLDIKNYPIIDEFIL
jgi:predicted MPP superfamily phosphohydrolase